MRNERKKKKWIRKMEEHKELSKTIHANAQEIFESKAFNSNKAHIQHGNVTVNEHCINVARVSLQMNRLFHMSCKEQELVRGALLHDFFLYDWHVGDASKPWKLHGFYHPGIALKNADEEFELTKRERDIIKKHMWPLTVVPPVYREGWVVTCADKWCSLMETFHIYKGHGKVELDKEQTEAE